VLSSAAALLVELFEHPAGYSHLVPTVRAIEVLPCRNSFSKQPVRGQSCVTTQNFGHLSWLMVLTQVFRLKASDFSLQPAIEGFISA
jgi:hypothetical protein